MPDMQEGARDTARQLVELYQEDAPVHAAIRSGQLADSGDICGSAHWLEISSRAAKLLSERIVATATAR